MSRIVSVVTDLLFRTKIESTARAVGADIVTVVSLHALETELRREVTELVIIDMAVGQELALDCIRRATDNQGVRVIAFFSHVEADIGEAARRAGATEVMPRSAFSARLPELLAGQA